MIIAAKRLKFTAEQIKQLDRQMYVEMDFVTEEEAERAYRSN